MFTNLNRYLACAVLALCCARGAAQPALDTAAVAPVVVRDTLPAPDSLRLPVAQDSLLAQDSLSADSSIAKNAISVPIYSKGDDSTIYLLGAEKHVLIYGNASVKFQDMDLAAYYIDFNVGTKVAFARGLYDTATHATVGKPVFKQGSETFEMDSMYFNFETKKAKIYAVITQQSDGYLHGEAIKRMPDNIIYVAGGKYTSCDQEHPHFYLALSRAKVVPNKQVVMGFAYFVLEDVPTPLAIPFGMFPQSSSRASGIIVPSYGEETSRGFYFREGGYYFAFNDYFDATLTGDYYTLGSWRASVRSSYRWKYHFSGGLSASYAYNVVGEEGSPDYNPSSAISLQWTHTQDPKFSPNKTFSASVNFTSSSYRRYNETTLNESLTNTTQSSISYS
ncbi:MAG: LPS-assembly protein LptD, partial [Prevotellaceae bacterium]|nr:LPS-assembly protein LptD [Prevotellaceae bacterium]